MPRSIVSTTSAWCSASRAAHEMASDGMVRGERVEVTRPRRVGAGRGLAQPAVDRAADQPGAADEDDRQREVEAEVEHHDLLVHGGHDLLQKDVGLRQHGDEEQRAQHLEDEVAERQPAHLRRRVRRGQQRQHAAADVGAEHQPERGRDRHQCRRGQRGDEQHDRQARVRHHRQHGADDDVEQDVVRQRDEQGAHGGRFGQRPRRRDDQRQRQRDEAEPDQDAADRAGAAVLLRDEDDDADEDEQRREPRQVEREDDRHHAGADVGTEHHRQRRARRHQVLADERRDDQAGGRARLHQARHAEPGDEGAEAVAEAQRQHAPQVLAEHTQHAGAHDVRAPDEQRDRGEQIEQVDQESVSSKAANRS